MWLFLRYAILSFKMKVDEFRDALKDDEVQQLFADIFDRGTDAKLSVLKRNYRMNLLRRLMN